MNWKDIEKRIHSGKNLTDEEKEFAKKKIKDYWEDHPDVLNRYPRWKKYLAWTAGYQNYDYNRLTKKLGYGVGQPAGSPCQRFSRCVRSAARSRDVILCRYRTRFGGRHLLRYQPTM